MKKIISLFLTAVMLCMVFPSTVFAFSTASLMSYTDMGGFVYEESALGVECKASAQWAINRAGIVIQMTAPKSDVTRMLRTESEFVIYWAHGQGKQVVTQNTQSVAADRLGGELKSDSVYAIFGEIGRKLKFANYITSEIRFYADDVLVCECTFDKMAYAGLYND